ncbi:MAG: hypothetical protein V3T24_02890, partial [Longimicrobiales bacterium]
VTQRLRAVSSLLLGALTGVLVVHGLDLGRGVWPWLLVCVVGFAAGSRVGYSAWRPTAVLVAMAVLALSILGLA